MLVDLSDVGVLEGAGTTAERKAILYKCDSPQCSQSSTEEGVSTLVVVIVVPQRESGYMQAIRDKRDRVAMKAA